VSDNFVLLVPADPWFVPSPEQEDGARRLYGDRMPRGEDLESTVAWPMGIVALGENSGTFWCPRCEAELDWEWIGELWDEREPRPLTVPCCGGTTTLADLRSDAGDCFARFTLQIRDPDCWEAPAEVVAAVGAVLGTPVVSATMRI
jgi:hypothetical protein